MKGSCILQGNNKPELITSVG